MLSAASVSPSVASAMVILSRTCARYSTGRKFGRLPQRRERVALSRVTVASHLVLLGKRPARDEGRPLLSSSRVEAAVLEGGLQLLDRRPHLFGFNTAVVPATEALAVIEPCAFDELRQGVPLLGRKVEDDLLHRPTTRSTNVASAASSALPLALRRSRKSGMPSRSEVSVTFDCPRSPGSSSFMG